jgi:hypothetical protein
MDTTLLNREDYILRVVPVSKEANKESCFKLLTFKNKHLLLCRNNYDDKYINSVIESSNYFVYYRVKENIEEIVCFALLKIYKNVCDILLLCAIPNTPQYGNMIAYAVYEFAISKKCNKIYTAPRTELLRNTFVKYGFEHLRGVKNYDEVLVKKITLSKYIKTPYTYRKKRLSTTYNKINIKNMNNMNNIQFNSN